MPRSESSDAKTAHKQKYEIAQCQLPDVFSFQKGIFQLGTLISERRNTLSMYLFMSK